MLLDNRNSKDDLKRISYIDNSFKEIIEVRTNSDIDKAIVTVEGSRSKFMKYNEKSRYLILSIHYIFSL